MFEVGQSRACHDVIIIDDEECESMPENFFADLELGTGDLIIINPERTVIIITDGDDDCGKYASFPNLLSHKLWENILSHTHKIFSISLSRYCGRV